jgi:hypothetical protein
VKVDLYFIGACVVAVVILAVAIAARVWLWHLLGPWSLLIK